MDSIVRQNRRTIFKIAIALSLLPAMALAATEEQRLLEIAKKLKPIPDTQWNEIAGAKINDTYDVVKGDNLWDISKRLFGNSFYWPKVWALNHGIPNPHVIDPGQKLAFTAGSSESLPKLAPAAQPTSSSEGIEKANAQISTDPTVGSTREDGSREYDKIPPGKWAPEKASDDTKNYDEYGIDKELKIKIPVRFSFRIPEIANDTTIPYLGEIVSTRREGNGIANHDAVFLKSNSQDLQVGTTYTIFSEPEFVRERRSDRTAYIYKTAGEVKIVGVKDELYIGVITSQYDIITRGMKLYPLLPLVTDNKPAPARTALEALVVMSPDISTRNSAQYRFIHLDRGIEDGVQIGNVFRIYDYYDPVTQAKITDSDFLVNADAIVIHATAQFSTALVLRSHDTFTRGDFAVLLTDVSDIAKELRSHDHVVGEDEDKRAPEDRELDELDELDKSTGDGMGKKEETEIKELDQWDKTKETQAPSSEPTVPSPADQPTDQAEQRPGSEAEPAQKAPPQDPSLDQMLDSPAVTPPGLETPPPPAHTKPSPDQTLEAPPAPAAAEEPVIQNSSEASSAPPVEPMLPPEGGSATPGQATPQAPAENSPSQ